MNYIISTNPLNFNVIELIFFSSYLATKKLTINVSISHTELYMNWELIHRAVLEKL